MVCKLIETLTPIEDITKEMSGADTSISCNIPMVALLRRYLESLGENTRGFQTLRKEMLDSLNRRFGAMEETREVLLACILDPHYKQRPLSVTTTNRAKVWLQEEAAKLRSRQSTAASSSTVSATTDTSSSTASSSTASSSTASSSRAGPSQSQHLLDTLYDTCC